MSQYTNFTLVLSAALLLYRVFCLPNTYRLISGTQIRVKSRLLFPRCLALG